MGNCSICFREPTDSDYPGMVCARCDDRALNTRGLPPEVSDESGDNPVFIDDVQCWRLYRFGGWVTMRDDTPCRTLDEFYGMTKFEEWSVALRQAAEDALRSGGLPAAPGIGPAPRKGSAYEGASFQFDGQPWVAVATSLVKSNAQLLDATNAYREATRSFGAVAILRAPAEPSEDKSTPEYLARYRRAAWHGLRVAWFLENTPTWTVDPVRPLAYASWLTPLAEDLRAALASQQIEGLPGSKDAEQIVVPIASQLLEAHGFVPATKRYSTFWRGAESDGYWTRPGDSPRSIAVEVKLEEDLGAPFCQVFENLGRGDTVIQVRLVNRRTRPLLDELHRTHPWVVPAKARLAATLPVRFLEIDA